MSFHSAVAAARRPHQLSTVLVPAEGTVLFFLVTFASSRIRMYSEARHETENRLVVAGDRGDQLPADAGPGEGSDDPGTGKSGGVQTRHRREGESKSEASRRVGSSRLHQQGQRRFV